MASEQEIIEEELVYGALRRERLWQRLGLIGLIFGILGCLSAAAVAILDVDPPPVVVPYDPATGFALRAVRPRAIHINEQKGETQMYAATSQSPRFSLIAVWTNVGFVMLQCAEVWSATRCGRL